MQYIISAPHFTSPTYDTLVAYAKERFSKLKKILRPSNDFEYEVKVSASKTGQLFVVKVAVEIPELVFISVKDRDLRRAIDLAKDQIVAKVKKTIDKKKG